MMSIKYTAIITKDEDWRLGWIKEIPGANAQGRTKEKLTVSLKEAAKDIIELRRFNGLNLTESGLLNSSKNSTL